MTRLLIAAALTAGCTSPTISAHIATTPSPVALKTSPAPTRTGEARSVPANSPRPTPSRASRSRLSTGQALSVTAYCWTGNRTASGVWPQIGMAAGNAWPFGTRLRVEGVGVVTVTDRWGSGTDLDIYMGREGCEQRARRFGRQQLTVAVVR